MQVAASRAMAAKGVATAAVTMVAVAPREEAVDAATVGGAAASSAKEVARAREVVERAETMEECGAKEAAATQVLVRMAAA